MMTAEQGWTKATKDGILPEGQSVPKDPNELVAVAGVGGPLVAASNLSTMTVQKPTLIAPSFDMSGQGLAGTIAGNLLMGGMGLNPTLMSNSLLAQAGLDTTSTAPATASAAPDATELPNRSLVPTSALLLLNMVSE